MNIRILRHDSLGSTNTEAANQARLGAGEGLCVLAKTQTAGRGRHGRKWVSSEGSGLYFSIVLRPKLDTRSLPLITLMAGVAVFDTLKVYGLKPDIKWVNDLLVGEKKIGGILAETVEAPNGLAVILGIGVNLTSRNFPDEIAETATSIEAETGKRIDSDEMAEHLTGYLSYFYDVLNGDVGGAAIVEEWRIRSTYFVGKHVRVTVHGKVIEGVTDGLETSGALRLKRGDGSVVVVQAGDVTRLRAD